MRATRVRLTSWTSSFRYSGFMIGFQPTLPIPPLSTVYGLASAAVGRPVTPEDTFVAYTFTSEGTSVDLEKILEVEPGQGGKTNVIKREFLSDVELFLYVKKEIGDSFKKPHYPLLLGRSTDLATVEEVVDVELAHVRKDTEAYFGRGLYSNPPPGYSFAAIYAVPLYFSDSIPREPIGTRRLFIIKERYAAKGEGYIDRTLPEDKQCVMEIHGEGTLEV